VRTIQKQTSELSHSIWTPSSEKGLSLVGIRSMDKVAVRASLSSVTAILVKTHTKPVGLDTMSLLILLFFFNGEAGERTGMAGAFVGGPSGSYLGPTITLGWEGGGD
jgi:hypothetical protein